MNGETKAKLTGKITRGTAYSVTAGASAGTIWWFLGQLGGERVAKLAEGFGGYFVITLGFMVIAVLVINKAAPFLSQLVDAQLQLSENVGKMAAAIQVIASKDDQRDRELELMLSALARNSEATMIELAEIKKRLPA